MIDIVIFLVFSIVLLFFMAFPAMKIVEFISNRYKLSLKAQNIYILLLTVVFSLIIGGFLKYF